MINETHLTPRKHWKPRVSLIWIFRQSFANTTCGGVFIMNVKGRFLGFVNELSATTEAHLNSLLSQYTRPCFSIESQTSPNECTAAQGCADVENRSRNLICFSNVRKKVA